MTLAVEYSTHNLKDLQVKVAIADNGKRQIESVSVDGRPVEQSRRFWTSLFARYGFGNNMFAYFDPAEVFQRITERREDDRIRVCTVQSGPDEQGNRPLPTLMAISSPEKPILQYDQIVDTLNQFEVVQEGKFPGIRYANGTLLAGYVPRGESPFEIAGDAFQARYNAIVPIDGYGSPEIVLGTLRMICTNGMIAFDKVFSSKIPSGKDIDGGLSRVRNAIAGYGNDEGFDALRRRLVTATESIASVAECADVSGSIMRVLGSSGTEKEDVRKLFDEFDRIAGNPTMMYGLVSATAVGRKRLQSLPSRATVYDLMNFATEVATHHVKDEDGARVIHGLVGKMLGDEYDLEGSAKGGRDHIDIYLQNMTGPAQPTKDRASILDQLSSGDIDGDLN